MKLRTVLKLGSILVVLGIAAVAVVIWHNPALRWRFQAVAAVAAGRIPDLSLGDAIRMAMPGSGYWLEDLAERGNAYATIKNPRTSDADLAAGRDTFKSDCAGCHGADAHGGTGPALVNRQLTHGDSDWAVLRTIKYGVPGTSMPPHAWDYTRIWQAVTYIRSQDSSQTRDADPPPERTASIDVPYAELKAVEQPGKDWLIYGGAYSGTRHSSLQQINRTNVANLAPRWVYQFKKIGERIQMTPIVRDGVMFVTHAASVMAIDARDGSLIWEFDRPPPADALACCGVVNRGVAIMGDRLFVGTVDAKIVAISARTGKKIWETTVDPNYAQGISITSAPLAFGNLVVTGVGGGDYPNRGYIAAFDADTGKPRWRFDTVPAPGQPGHDTWPANNSWEHGGGATWLTGSYDPKNDIVLWGIGNPAPEHNAANRKGDNLYTDSVVALRGATGQLLWHFQFTPNDDHDWDSVQTPVIIERPQSSTPHQLLWANRNGFFYDIDRDNGKFLHGAAFVKENWATGLDANGRPLRIAAASPSPTGSLVWPGVIGATNWWSPSYDPELDLMFIPALEYAGLYYSTGALQPQSRQLYLSGYTEDAPGIPHYQKVVAVHAADGTIAWTRTGSASKDDDLHLSGLTSTAGGLVFASEDKTFYALDSSTGKMLWSFPTGARITAAAVSFEVNGEELISIASGRDLMTFGLVGAK